MTTASTPQVRRALVGAVAIAAATGLMACSVDAASPSSAAPNDSVIQVPHDTNAAAPVPGAELTAAQIPWDQVGPGWTLAMWSSIPGRHPGEKVPEGEPMVGPATLFLLAPTGQRYAVTTLSAEGADPASDDPGHTAVLADWSGDGRHALLQVQDTCREFHDPHGWHCIDPGASKQHTTFTDIDMTTGSTRTLTVNSTVDGEYTRPTGQAVLLSPHYPNQTTLRRVDLNGAEQLSYPTDLGAAGQFTGNYLASSDGTQLVFGGDNGMVMVGNDGVVGRRLPVPDSITKCRPVRWWSRDQILADCTDVASKGDQLWTVPTDGGQPAALTAPNTGQPDSGFGGDLHDAAAWQLPSGTFIQSLGACGTVFVSRLTPDMHTTRVSIPGVNNSSVQVEGTAGDKLIVQGHAGCGPGTSLLAFDPAAGTAKVLLGPEVNGGSVQRAIVYPNR